MISGTIYSTGKMMAMTQKWEQKKATEKILNKETRNLSPEEKQIQFYQQRLEEQKESNKYSSIYAKIQGGQELSPAEEDVLRQHDPQTYMAYKADQAEQKAYEERLRKCKTKEEAERLHVNRLNGKLSELKSIIHNPNIPKSEKLAAAQRILGETTKTVAIYNRFVNSAEFKKLPTEEEIKTDDCSNVEKEEVSRLKQDSAAEAEENILGEIFELSEKHFEEPKETRKIDIVV